MTCCDFESNGQGPVGPAGPAGPAGAVGPAGPSTPEALADARVYYDWDFEAEPSQALTDGVHVIDGIPWTKVQSALQGTNAQTLGSGITYTAPAAARTWSFASLTTAPYMYTTLADLPLVDMRMPLIVEAVLGAQSYPFGNDAIRFGFWTLAGVPYAASTQRGRIVDRGNFGATSTVRVFDGATPTTSPEAFAPDVVGIRQEPIAGFAGTEYGTWVGPNFPRMNMGVQLQTAMGNVNPGFSLATRLVIVWISQGNGMAVNLRRMRLLQG